MNLYQIISKTSWKDYMISGSIPISARDIDRCGVKDMSIETIHLRHLPGFCVDVGYKAAPVVCLWKYTHERFVIITEHPDEYFTIFMSMYNTINGFKLQNDCYVLCDTIDGVKQYIDEAI